LHLREESPLFPIESRSPSSPLIETNAPSRPLIRRFPRGNQMRRSVRRTTFAFLLSIPFALAAFPGCKKGGGAAGGGGDQGPLRLAFVSNNSSDF